MRTALLATLALLLAALAPGASAQTDAPHPDGQIVYHSDRDGDSEIYVMNGDGTNIRQLTDNGSDDLYPAWSPDGRRIAYDADGNRLIIMNADGSDPTTIYQADGRDPSLPDWSPDGTQIVFQADEPDDLYIIDADGDNLRQLTFNNDDDERPTWSPDGTQIAFQSRRDGDWEIYLTDPNGFTVTQLTDNEETDFSPEWSPDGTQIAFYSDRDGDWEIFVMNADGSDQRQLTNNEASDFSPAWSPDGTQIAFISTRDGDWEIFVMNADGSDQRQLTFNDWNDQWPDWAGAAGPAVSAGPPPTATPIVERALEVGEILITDPAFQRVIDVDRFRLPNCSAPGTLRLDRTFSQETTTAMFIGESELQQVCESASRGGSSRVEAGVAFEASIFSFVTGTAMSSVSTERWGETVNQVCETLASQQGFVEGTVFAEQTTVSMEAPAGTQVEYEILWYTQSLSGFIELIFDGDTVLVPFSIPESLEVEIGEPVSEACP